MVIPKSYLATHEYVLSFRSLFRQSVFRASGFFPNNLGPFPTTFRKRDRIVPYPNHFVHFPTNHYCYYYYYYNYNKYLHSSIYIVAYLLADKKMNWINKSIKHGLILFHYL